MSETAAPVLEKPVIEGEPRRNCPRCISTPGLNTVIFRGKMPNGVEIKGGTVKTQTLCNCVINSAARNARQQGIFGEFTVKLKEKKTDETI